MKGSKLIAPAFDYELAAGTGTVSGDFDLEAIPAVLAEGIAQSIGTLAETGLKGIGTFLDGINNIINPSDQVPPMVGMTPIA